MDRRGLIKGSTILSLAAGFGGLNHRAFSQEAALPPLSAYARNPMFEDICLSPDGEKVAFMTTVKNVRYLVFFTIKTKEKKFFPMGDFKARSIRFVGPNHLLLTTTITQYLEIYGNSPRNELMQAHLINTKTLKLKTLFDGVDLFYNMVTGDIATYIKGGKYYVTASNVIEKGDYWHELHSFDVETGDNRLLDSGSIYSLDWVIDGEGGLVAKSEYDRSTHLFSVFWYNKGFWKKIFEEKHLIDRPSLLGLGPQGDTVLLRMNSGTLDMETVELRPDGSLSEPIEGARGVGKFLFHPKTKHFVGFKRGTDWPIADYRDPALKKIHEAIKADYKSERFRIADMAEDFRKVLVYSEGPKSTGEYSYIDYGSGGYFEFDQNYPEIPQEFVAEKVKIRYEAQDGLKIEAYLTLPPAKEPKGLPLVVLVHGGPQARDTIAFDWEAQAYASRGYCVLQVNYRGSDGYGTEFLEAGYGQWAKKMQTDLSDGVRYLTQKGTIDPKRVAISGASYGGYAALAGAAFDAGVYRCAISVAGVSDVKALRDEEFNRTGRDNSASAILYWQRYWGNVSLDEISPIKKVADITIPILLIHGKNDTVVQVEQSQRMAKALKVAGKPHKYIEFNKEDHWQSLGPARLEMITEIMNFLKLHNPA